MLMLCNVGLPTSFAQILQCKFLKLHTPGARGLLAVSSLSYYKPLMFLVFSQREEPLGKSAIPLMALSQLQDFLLLRRHPESGHFADWLLNLLGDVRCIKCCDWATIITTDAWSECMWRSKPDTLYLSRIRSFTLTPESLAGKRSV